MAGGQISNRLFRGGNTENRSSEHFLRLDSPDCGGGSVIRNVEGLPGELSPFIARLDNNIGGVDGVVVRELVLSDILRLEART